MFILIVSFSKGKRHKIENFVLFLTWVSLSPATSRVSVLGFPLSSAGMLFIRILPSLKDIVDWLQILKKQLL